MKKSEYSSPADCKNSAVYAKWLQKHIAKHHFTEVVFSRWCPGNYQHEIEAYCQFRSKRRWLKVISQKKIREHLEGSRTLYFTADWDRRNSETIIAIDIDVHQTGSTVGALAFAEHCGKLFPGLVYEASTNGKGIHAYLILHKGHHDSLHVSRCCKYLQEVLQAHAQGFDISGVEVKGLPAVYHRSGASVTSVNMGQLCKLPRTDVRGTAHISLDEIITLEKPARKMTIADGKKGSCVLIPMQVFRQAKAQSYSVARTCAKTRGGVRIYARDVEIALAVLWFCHQRPNEDMTLPHARVEAIWQSLFQSGAVSRAFDGKRWKAIRDAMSQLGMIRWHDNTYYWKTGDKGRACQWSITNETAERLGNTNRTTERVSLREVIPFVIPIPGFASCLYPDIEKVWTERRYSYADSA